MRFFAFPPRKLSSAEPKPYQELAADTAINAAYGLAGERCMAIAALIAVEPVADALLKAIRQRMTGLCTGDGTRQVDMGLLVTGAHRDKVAGYIDAGLREGAMLVVGGRAIEVDGEASGYWLGLSLFDGVQEGISIYRDEISGPVLCVLRVQSYTGALNAAMYSPKDST